MKVSLKVSLTVKYLAYVRIIPDISAFGY